MNPNHKQIKNNHKFNRKSLYFMSHAYTYYENALKALKEGNITEAKELLQKGMDYHDQALVREMTMTRDGQGYSVCPKCHSIHLRIDLIDGKRIIKCEECPFKEEFPVT